MKETPPVDIVQLLEDIEDVVGGGWAVPGMNRSLVDAERVLELVEAVRERLPREMLSARQVAAESGQLRQESQAAAQQVLETARAQAAELVSRDAIYKEAAQQARVVIEQAERHARETRASADEYAAQSLRGFEERLAQTLATVRNGIAALDAARAQRGTVDAATAPMPSHTT